MYLGMAYLWVKALHIAFVVTWFAGLFYLPRLFIYHVEATTDAERERFTVMEQRLFIIMTIGAVLTTLFGLTLLWSIPALLAQGWFKLKLLLLTGLLVYHIRSYRWIQTLKMGPLPTNTRWLRWFNEIPVVFLLGIICLAVVKPL